MLLVIMYISLSFFQWHIPYYNCFLINFSIYELIDHINGYICIDY